MTTAPAFPLLDPDPYGPALGGHTVRQAVRDTVQLWSPTYIGVVAGRLGLPMVPFQHWTALPEYRSLPQNLAAACWATCLGTRGLPARKGDGAYQALYGVEVSTLVYGGDWDQTEDLTSAYNLAVRMLLLQHRSLGGVAAGLAWLSETYSPVNHTATRTLGVYRALYEVRLDGVTSTAGGPAPGVVPSDPPDITLPDPPTVEQTNITIIREPQ